VLSEVRSDESVVLAVAAAPDPIEGGCLIASGASACTVGIMEVMTHDRASFTMVVAPAANTERRTPRIVSKPDGFATGFTELSEAQRRGGRAGLIAAVQDRSAAAARRVWDEAHTPVS
jgi:hypothetical protein